MERWYVLRTKPRAEAQVSQLLAPRGIPCYCPQLTRRLSGRLRTEPLFPGYLFARLGADPEHWKLARWSPGVAYILGGERSYVPVPDDVVGALRTRAAYESARAQRITFRAGEPVVIASGPLAGLEAVFDRMLSPSGRSRVLLEFLSRFTPVELNLALLRPRESYGERAGGL